MITALLVLPVVRAYAALSGRPVDEARLRADLLRRLECAPPAARAAAAAGALLLRWCAPPLFLGRWRRFDRLESSEADLLLQRLQWCERPALRGPFLALKPLLLAGAFDRAELTHAGG